MIKNGFLIFKDFYSYCMNLKSSSSPPMNSSKLLFNGEIDGQFFCCHQELFCYLSLCIDEMTKLTMLLIRRPLSRGIVISTFSVCILQVFLVFFSDIMKDILRNKL